MLIATTKPTTIRDKATFGFGIIQCVVFLCQEYYFLSEPKWFKAELEALCRACGPPAVLQCSTQRSHVPPTNIDFFHSTWIWHLPKSIRGQCVCSPLWTLWRTLLQGGGVLLIGQWKWMLLYGESERKTNNNLRRRLPSTSCSEYNGYAGCFHLKVRKYKVQKQHAT